ncbi:hypothetical protein [Polaribacter butkevichii]|uniref:Uncharacterized protein n=1 Tax=Polaribacter butkevichii TaxID=218490 RepID=A0A2P6CCW9_9FLAO|nr:hypothetical protein [Polaribacter butkevichii]PQJ72754.1 hypothetical protein BTO14_05555 [Polaribacter butkevichii]
MNFKKIAISPFSAKMTLGLELGYTKKRIKKEEVIKYLQEYQEKLINDKNLVLSVSVTESIIVLSGQVEPHLQLNFINYPKFQLEENILKIEIENLTRSIMQRFEQNRVVIEYLNETIMFEDRELIDPRIKK